MRKSWIFSSNMAQIRPSKTKAESRQLMKQLKKVIWKLTGIRKFIKINDIILGNAGIISLVEQNVSPAKRGNFSLHFN